MQHTRFCHASHNICFREEVFAIRGSRRCRAVHCHGITEIFDEPLQQSFIRCCARYENYYFDMIALIFSMITADIDE